MKRKGAEQGLTERSLKPGAWVCGEPEEIFSNLRLLGLEGVADRLSYLNSLAKDDPDEPRMDLESLRAMALFVMGQRNFPDPRIGITPNGYVQTDWRVSTNGVLAMEFLPSGLVRFAAISAPAVPGVERQLINGTLPVEDTLAAIKPFTALL